MEYAILIFSASFLIASILYFRTSIKLLKNQNIEKIKKDNYIIPKVFKANDVSDTNPEFLDEVFYALENNISDFSISVNYSSISFRNIETNLRIELYFTEKSGVYAIHFKKDRFTDALELLIENNTRANKIFANVMTKHNEDRNKSITEKTLSEFNDIKNLLASKASKRIDTIDKILNDTK